MSVTTEVAVSNSPARKAPAKPQDHKAKVEKPRSKKVDGGYDVTFKGLTVFVARDSLDDFELLDELRQVQDGDPSLLPSILRRLVGKAYKDVLESLRDPESGRVSGEAGGKYVMDLFEVIGGGSGNS